MPSCFSAVFGILHLGHSGVVAFFSFVAAHPRSSHRHSCPSFAPIVSALYYYSTFTNYPVYFGESMPMKVQRVRRLGGCLHDRPGSVFLKLMPRLKVDSPSGLFEDHCTNLWLHFTSTLLYPIDSSSLRFGKHLFPRSCSNFLKSLSIR